GTKFATTADGTIASGATSSGSIPVTASVVGSSGNVAAGAICVIPYAIEDVDSVTNAASTLGGTDEETDASRAARFARYVKTLPRGTGGSLEYAAESVSGVVEAKAIEPYMLDTPPDDCPYAGLVWLWIDTGVGDGTIDSGISTKLTKVINGYQDAVEGWVEGWKAAGVIVTLKGTTSQGVKIKGYFTVNDSAKSRFATEIAPLLTAKATAYFSDLGIGDSVIHNALMLELASVDSDIVEIGLKIWLDTEDEPSDTTPRNLVMVDSSDAETTGYRAVLDTNSYTESGAKITYPYWSLA
ncbi:MAG TPA: baseplate J/gp47 family protein, partial [Holophaga sp.]|nr:baseplate J/gp47 family protein [Holophaga sp.]